MKRVLASLALSLLAAAASAQTVPCGDKIQDQPLQSIPELVRTSDGVLRGTLYTVNERQKISTPGTTPTCYGQIVRAYRPSAPASWTIPSNRLNDPMPGPTLRARTGDMVELTFMNLIDPNNFPGVDDNQCDQTSTYPKNTGDQYPDCFAGSVYTNVHFHGTHTNPNTLGDNVFLNVKPSPRAQDASRTPAYTVSDFQPAFTQLFNQCAQELASAAGPKIWPRVWSDVPSTVQSVMMDPVKKWAPEWWTANQKLIEDGKWPQYFVAAYPYCFKLPTATATTPTITPAAITPHTHGAGTAEVAEASAPMRPMLMGQAPGTHWYHAHKHGSTTINVMNGMTGAFIIEGQYDDDINNYYGANWTRSSAQKVLVVQQLGTIPSLLGGGGGGPGPDFSVNGRLRPTITMPGKSVQFWRIANTTSRGGIYFIPPAEGTLRWKQLAQDGVQFAPENYNAKENVNHDMLLASGNRADLLVEAPAYVKGARNTYAVQVYNTVDPTDRPPFRAQTPITLFTVVVTPDQPGKGFMSPAPTFPTWLGDVKDSEITGTKLLTFGSLPITKSPQHTIDGKVFDGEVGAVVLLNRAEEWKIENKTFPPATGNQVSHPFHIHINPFQVTEVFDPNAVESSKAGTGTVSMVKKTSKVMGKGTKFKSEFQPSDWIWINQPGGMAPGIVVSIQSDEEMTLNITAASDVNDATFTAAVPLYTVDKSTARKKQCVLDPKDPATWHPCSPTEPAEHRIWWDVFSIPSGNNFVDPSDNTKTVQIPGYFKMRSRFVDYSGYYVLHCHILAHEDRGMMTVVEVAPLQTPYSHH